MKLVIECEPTKYTRGNVTEIQVGGRIQLNGVADYLRIISYHLDVIEQPEPSPQGERLGFGTCNTTHWDVSGPHVKRAHCTSWTPSPPAAPQPEPPRLGTCYLRIRKYRGHCEPHPRTEFCINWAVAPPAAPAKENE